MDLSAQSFQSQSTDAGQKASSLDQQEADEGWQYNERVKACRLAEYPALRGK